MNPYSLLDDLMDIQPRKPDRQLLLYSPESVRETIDFRNLLAQFKWCLENEVADECYTELKKRLTAYSSAYNVDILIRQYRQIKRNKTEIMNIF